MIDLHTHTTESDGSFSSEELVRAAVEIGLEALAITDHDTLTGYDRAVPFAAQARLDLVCGIELSTQYRGRSVHLLGYFLTGDPTREFRQWIGELQQKRHLRNQRLVEKLQDQDMPISFQELEKRSSALLGRPHFAALMVEKGYASSIQQAFTDYLSESGSCFVPREEPSLADGIQRIAAAGGLPSLPHPGRVSKSPSVLADWIAEMQGFGLRAIEAYHSDHSEQDINLYRDLAKWHTLAVTGGSDFHGTFKPKVALGTGINNRLNIPRSVLDALREHP